MAPVAVGRNQVQHSHLASLVLGADSTGTELLHPGTILGLQQEVFTNSRMGNVRFDGGINTGEFFEVDAPVFRHRIGVSQIGFVQFVDIGGIGSSDMGGLPLALHGTVLHVSSFLQREVSHSVVGGVTATTGGRPCSRTLCIVRDSAF